MKEVYVDGYDTVVEFPDETPDAEIQKALASNFPETDDQFVNRIADPATPASAVSFDDFKRYQELKPELSWGDLGNLVVQGAGVAAGELYNGVKSTASMAAQGKLGTLGASVAEGAARGTYDLASLGKRIQDNVTSMLEPYMQESGDAQKDQYNRFLAIKEMDNVREAARKGDATILQRFGIGVDPSMVDTESAEGFSYFLDPTVIGTGGSGKLASMLTKAGAKPAELAGRAAGGLARGISKAESKAAELLKSGTAKVDEMTGGLGKYAIPGSIGAAAYGAGLGVTGGAAAAAIGAVPALELAEGLFKGFSHSMLNNPTRIGPMRHLAMTAPATLAGKAAGNLKWMDPALDLAAKGTTGAVIGSAYGAGLGGLAAGWEGAAQGLGAGSVLGAGTAGTMRLAEGVTGRAKVRAEQNDYTNWRLTQDKDTQDFLDNNIKTHTERVQVMDAIQLAQAGVGDQATVRVLSGDDFNTRFPGADGVQVVEGDVPIAYINGRDGNSRVLFHEIFHSMARLDGFDSLVAGISNEIGKMYSPDEVNALIREYESLGKPLKESEGLVTTGDKFAALAEEIGAEYFANYIKGKDSSYLLKGTPFKDALNSITSKFVAGKLDRVYNTFQSEIFKNTHLKQSKGMDRAMNDLIKARRKAYRDVELSADDAIRAYGERDLGNDQIFKELQALGVAELDNKGKRVIKTNYKINKETKELGQQVKDVLEGVDDTGGMIRQSDGSYKGRNFSPSQIQTLMDSPFLSDKVKDVIQFIDEIRRSGSDAMNVTYAAATYKTKPKKNKKWGKTKYRNLPISNRDVLLYGLDVSPVGTITANILDLSLIRAKIKRLWRGNSDWQSLFGSGDKMYGDAITYINALGGEVPTATVLGSAEKRNQLNKLLGIRNVKGNPELPDTYNLKEADHPWRSFRLDRFVKGRKLEDLDATFSQQAYEKGQANFSPSRFKPGQKDTLTESDLVRFSPSPDNPNASLKDFVGKKVQVLTSDLSTGKDKKVDGITVSFRGGPAYLEMFDGWAFTNEGSAKAFRTRWERDGRPLIGITSMLPNNHLNSKLARRYYAAKWRELVEQGKIAESTVNKHLRAAMKRVVKGKSPLTSDQRKAVAGIRNHHDFAKVFENIPWKAAPAIYSKLDAKTLPITPSRQESLGVDLQSVADATREDAYSDVGPGHLLAIAEYNGADPVHKPDLNENYPWYVPLKEKAFLDQFHEVTEMTSREDVKTSSGKPNTAVLMGAGVTLDKLASGDVHFSPTTTPTKADQTYLKAVQAGDTATAQKMVDEAAKKAGYWLKAFHGTSSDEFHVFDMTKTGKGPGGPNTQFHRNAAFFTIDGPYIRDLMQSINLGSGYGNREMQLYLKPDTKKDYIPHADLVKHSEGGDESGMEIGITDPNRIKSADPITYDDQGNVIPLSERFNQASDDIRFSPARQLNKSAAEIKQWAESHTADQLRESLSKMKLTPTSKMLELIGKFPDYLNPVVDYIVTKRQALVDGNISPRDVAKAYWITLSSIGADAIDLSTIQRKASSLGLEFNPDEMFLSKGKKGQDQMRPEELAAWWLGTESGQKALDAIERGVIDRDAWETGMAMRDAFGRQDFRPNEKRVGGIGTIKNRGEFNLSNILPLTDAINATRGNPKQLDSLLKKVKGISDGKKGFIGHLLGLGDFPTIDAVELNVWLTGKGSTTYASTKAKERVALAKKASGTKGTREELFGRIVKRIKDLRKSSPEGSKIPESVAPHIIHHWIWDAAKGVQTTHKGLYFAMIHFSPARQLNNRGGAIYTTPQGHRAVQTSSRAGVRVYDSAGKRVGPVFQSVEKAQDWLAKRQ